MSPLNTTVINSEHLNDRGDVVADTTLAPPGSSGAFLWVKATRPPCEAAPLATGLSETIETETAEEPTEPQALEADAP